MRFAALIGAIRWAATAEFSPRLPPWSLLPNDSSVASRLRFAATRSGRLMGHSRKARIALILLSVVWAVKATYDATRLVLKYGTRVNAASSVGRWRQWRDAMTLAHRWNYSPMTYYGYRFWDLPHEPTECLQVFELVFILMPHLVIDILSDKVVLAAHSAAAGIRMPPLVATLERESGEGISEALPRRDLFVKRVHGMQGDGAERWVFKDERWSRRGRSLTESELIEHCRHLARVDSILIQHCLTNHPDIARFSAGSLCTFRVMTYGDTPRVLAITLKLARKDADVDNLHAGSVACPVDQATGRLGSGVSLDPAEERWRVHPDTLVQIEGAHLTTHREVIRLALEAHEKLDVPWSVGWDVAMTPDGPILLEGNPLWSVDLFHVPHRSGITQDFGEGLLKLIGS